MLARRPGAAAPQLKDDMHRPAAHLGVLARFLGKTSPGESSGRLHLDEFTWRTACDALVSRTGKELAPASNHLRSVVHAAQVRPHSGYAPGRWQRTRRRPAYQRSTGT
jgi:hypothetical protein